VSGYWVQNHVGTLDRVRETAHDTEAANHGKIEVAVVAELFSTTPALDFYSNLTRLDIESLAST
jgi:hypothetical protein